MSHREHLSPAGSMPRSPAGNASFPIITVAIVGILATGLLLVSYYVFVIKCCLNWNRADGLLRRLRSRQGSAADGPLPVRNRGLRESAIRSIPVFCYGEEHAAARECAVCLGEFQESQKLRIIPSCRHYFHVDCIDVWLQSNATCPLCRTAVSAAVQDPVLIPRTNPQDPILTPRTAAGDEDDDRCVPVVGIHAQGRRKDEANGVRERIVLQSGVKRAKDLTHVSSFGDEWIESRNRDDRFGIAPIRRSFSMNSAADRQIYSDVQEIVQRQGCIPAAGDHHLSEGGGGSSSSRVKRSFFSFGQGWGSRNAVQPVVLFEP
ncbi:hypothetical protein DM860_001695 [Cuscuta australis]|uniref:RING-type E3 ubiquitin transferase n=2 Tax=Cuscuta sect. Cleistogrammica TaxID=1824901 RepID=A0A328E9M3_9ASTE|nr:hypothetical protein DM860_001695 [Cuscuta australis]